MLHCGGYAVPAAKLVAWNVPAAQLVQTGGDAYKVGVQDRVCPEPHPGHLTGMKFAVLVHGCTYRPYPGDGGAYVQSWHADAPADDAYVTGGQLWHTDCPVLLA